MPEVETNRSRWPKTIPVLSPEQQVAREGWMRYWHEYLPQSKFSFVEKFNHDFPAELHRVHAPSHQIRTLEVGAGLGEHRQWEDLSRQEYHQMEYRADWVEILKEKYPGEAVVGGDIQQKLPYADGYFDRVIAIHVLEHLPNLPAALQEIQRLLKDGGVFDIVIPCEGGGFYELARNLTTARLFKKKFKMSYKPIMQVEHINTVQDILACFKEYPNFKVQRQSYFPFRVPSLHANVCLGMRFQKKV